MKKAHNCLKLWYSWSNNFRPTGRLEDKLMSFDFPFLHKSWWWLRSLKLMPVTKVGKKKLPRMF